MHSISSCIFSQSNWNFLLHLALIQVIMLGFFFFFYVGFLLAHVLRLLGILFYFIKNVLYCMYQELIKLHCFKIVYMEALQLYFNIPELKGFAYLIFFLP